ncbi:MAG: hypothetical protein ABWW69_03280 [Pyrodictiaceae archaeon]
MAESRLMLYSVLAGLIAGLVSSAPLVAALDARAGDMLRELLYQSLVSQGLSPLKASELASRMSHQLSWLGALIPVSPTINMVIMGALLGLVAELLYSRLQVAPGLASLVSAAILAVLYYVSLAVQPETTRIIEKYIGLYPVISGVAVYAALFLTFTVIPGPWRSIAESKPREY